MRSNGMRAAGGAGSDSENYLANVSDLVSGLIFVLILTLAVFALRLAEMTDVFADRTRELTSNRLTQAQILQDLRERIEESGLRVEIVPAQGILRLSENAISFPFGGETPINLANVGHLARALAEVVPCFVPVRSEAPAAANTEEGGAGPGDPDARAPNRSFCQPRDDSAVYVCPDLPGRVDTVLIEGHTDSVPVAPGVRFRNNLELSSMRAANVHRMIVACEPAIESLFNSTGTPILSTSGYGSTRPVGDDPEGAENRRIDLRFLLEPPVAEESPMETPVMDEVGERYDGRAR